jgi:hypothetical protein
MRNDQAVHALENGWRIVVWINHHSRTNAGQQQQGAQEFEVHTFGGTDSEPTVEKRPISGPSRQADADRPTGTASRTVRTPDTGHREHVEVR